MKNNSGSNSDAKFGCGCLVVILALVMASAVLKNSHRGVLTAKVVDKAIKRSSRDHDKYLIYTDQETLEDEDALLQGKFNSSDDYGRMQVGHTYRFEVTGWRVPFCSMYRNIISSEDVTPRLMPGDSIMR